MTARGLVWLAVAVLLLLPGNLAARGMQVENITWVPATGRFSENCRRLRDVLGALPSSPRQLVRLAPGNYYCNVTTLFVPTHVDLEGSGDESVIYGNLDNSALGIVHLLGGANLSRVRVQNHVPSPVNGVIAISIWELGSVQGSPKLVDVKTQAFGGHPLLVSGRDVVVEGGSFTGDGQIMLTGTGNTFKLRGAELLTTVNAAPGVTARCYFYVAPNLLPSDGPACP